METVDYLIEGNNWQAIKPLGNVFPDFQGRACPLKNGSGWVIVDETGWDGYSEYPPVVMENEGQFPSKKEAMIRIDEICASFEK